MTAAQNAASLVITSKSNQSMNAGRQSTKMTKAFSKSVAVAWLLSVVIVTKTIIAMATTLAEALGTMRHARAIILNAVEKKCQALATINTQLQVRD